MLLISYTNTAYSFPYSIPRLWESPTYSEPQILGRPTPGHFLMSGLLSTEGFKLPSFCTCSIYVNEYFCTYVIRRLFWKGAPYFECTEVWGAGSRHEDCRQQPPATDYVALCSIFDALNIQRENSNTKWRIDIDACVLNPPSDANFVPGISFCTSARMLLFAVSPSLISYVTKTSQPS